MDDEIDKQKGLEEFERYMQIIDGDFEDGKYLQKWMAVYTCFETVEYKEISSGRPVSYREL